MILSGRSINENMPFEVFNRIKKLINNNKINKRILNVLILGLTFKENCADIRNSKVFELLKCFNKNKYKINCYDPYIKTLNNIKKLKINIVRNLSDSKNNDIIILAVAHNEFKKLGFKKIKDLGVKKSIIYDITNTFINLDKSNRL